jgi:hypothetical protein
MKIDIAVEGILRFYLSSLKGCNDCNTGGGNL